MSVRRWRVERKERSGEWERIESGSEEDGGVGEGDGDAEGDIAVVLVAEVLADPSALPPALESTDSLSLSLSLPLPLLVPTPSATILCTRDQASFNSSSKPIAEQRCRPGVTRAYSGGGVIGGAWIGVGGVVKDDDGDEDVPWT